MICISIPNIPIDEILTYAKKYEFLELRFDLRKYSENEIMKIIDTKTNIIITDKSESNIDLLKFAMSNGVKYIDIDFQSENLDILINLSKSFSTKIIISYHNYELTPSKNYLENIILQANKNNAAICKIVCTNDNNNILNDLYNYNLIKSKNIKLIAFALGEAAKKSRIEAIDNGSPFMYCATDNIRTAKGQYTGLEFQQIITNKKK